MYPPSRTSRAVKVTGPTRIRGGDSASSDNGFSTNETRIEKSVSRVSVSLTTSNFKMADGEPFVNGAGSRRTFSTWQSGLLSDGFAAAAAVLTSPPNRTLPSRDGSVPWAFALNGPATAHAMTRTVTVDLADAPKESNTEASVEPTQVRRQRGSSVAGRLSVAVRSWQTIAVRDCTPAATRSATRTGLPLANRDHPDFSVGRGASSRLVGVERDDSLLTNPGNVTLRWRNV